MYMAKFICIVLSFELSEIIGALSLIFIGVFQGVQYVYEEKRLKSDKTNANSTFVFPGCCEKVFYLPNVANKFEYLVQSPFASH